MFIPKIWGFMIQIWQTRIFFFRFVETNQPNKETKLVWANYQRPSLPEVGRGATECQRKHGALGPPGLTSPKTANVGGGDPRWGYWDVLLELIVTILSKLGCNLLRGLTTYLYRGYYLFTKFHGHPSSNRWWPVVNRLVLCCIFLPGHPVIPPDVGCFGNFRVQIPKTSGGGPGWSGCLGSIIRDVSNYTMGFQPPLKLPGRRTFNGRHHRTPCWSSSRDWKRRRLMASSQRKISVRQGSVVNWRTAASTSKCLQGCGLRWRRKGWQRSTRRGRTTVAATATNPARGPEASIHAIDSDITGA